MSLTSDSATNIRLKAVTLGLLAPLAVLILTLKSLRVLGPREFDHLSEALALYRSDVLLLLLFSLVTYAVLITTRNQLRNVALSVLQVAGILWACIETIAHQFYVVTGSTIDFGIFLFSVQKLGDTNQVLLSETPVLLVLLLAQVALIMMFLPWYIIRKSSLEEHPRRLGAKPMLAIASAFFVSSAWSIIPTGDDDNPGFSRSNLINFAFSMVRMDDDITTGDITRSALSELRILQNQEDLVPKNIVLVILESTRASATTLYNPELATTPFLNSLKEQSLFAERAYAVVPHTSKALVAMHCGIEPHLTMPITEAGESGIPSRCLPRLLAEQGYRSVFFQSATRQFEERDGMVENLGYDEFFPLESMDREGMEPANYFGFEDAIMLPRSRDWLTVNGGEAPFLATYLTSTPHHDYLAPGNRYGSRKFSEDEEFNRYLNSVRYVDQFSRELIEQYKQLGLIENSLFVFVGDHGEAFDEHGRSQHDNIMWEEGLHVPLMIYDPSAPVGKVVTEPVNQLDLLPSLLNLLGFNLEGGSYPGQIFWNINSTRTLFAHCWYELGCMAAIEGDTKYIEHFGRRKNEYYVLSSDLSESNNLHSQLDPTDIERLRVQLFTWRQSVNSLYRSTGHYQGSSD